MGKSILVFMLAILVSRQAHGGIFGPSNYDECILEKMKGVSSDVAAEEVRKACKRRYPDSVLDNGTKEKAVSGSVKVASPKPQVSQKEAAKTSAGKRKSGETPAENKWEKYGDALFSKGKYEKAVKAYSSALVKASQKDLAEAGIYIKRSLAYKELNKYPNALRDANKAIAFNSQEARFYELRASLYYSMGSYRLAISDDGEAIRLNPRESKYYDMRALAFKAGGDIRQALHDIGTAITINPKDHTAYGLRGDIYYESKGYAQAVKDYTYSIELVADKPDTGYARLLTNRGLSYINSGHNEDGLKDLRKAAKMGGKEAQNYLSSSGMDW